MTITSTDGSIIIEANQKITLQAGQSAITLEGGNITFTCPGKFSVKGAAHPFQSGGRDAAVLEKLPSEADTLSISQGYNQHFELINNQTGLNLAYVNYLIELSDGSIYEGLSDINGKTELISAYIPLIAKIEVYL